MVIVSGGNAVSPFTTPTLACRRGLAAGNTNTALREHLLGRGHQVYTAPAMNRRGPVVEPDPDEFGSFGDSPVVLPASMTITSTGDIDLAGEHLARFVTHLHQEYGVGEIDLIGHSNGGLFARSAIRLIGELGLGVRIHTLTTLGTPWIGALPMEYVAGGSDLSICAGDPRCEQILAGAAVDASQFDLGLAAQDTRHFLVGPEGWNAAQAGVLDDVAILLVGGDHLKNPAGDPRYWPNDGLVELPSALASGLDESILPEADRLVVDDVHSIFIAEALGMAWDKGMTWDPVVLEAVHAHIARHG